MSGPRHRDGYSDRTRSCLTRSTQRLNRELASESLLTLGLADRRGIRLAGAPSALRANVTVWSRPRYSYLDT